MASANFETDSSKTTIAKTTSDGNRWVPFRNGYGGEKYRHIPTEIEESTTGPETIYAGGGTFHVAKTNNKGDSWKIILGSWESLGGLHFIKSTENTVWAGGSSATFRALLYKSTDSGNTWQEIPISGAEANVNDLLVKSGSSNIVIAGLEGALSSAQVIRKSTDGGESWETVHEGFGARTMAHSARNPKTVYASGKNDSGSLFFAKSTDFGETWQQVQIPDAPSGIVVNDMISVMAGGEEVLYFGTNKGVFSYRPEEE